MLGRFEVTAEMAYISMMLVSLQGTCVLRAELKNILGKINILNPGVVAIALLIYINKDFHIK